MSQGLAVHTVGGQVGRIAGDGAGETALRADRELVERDIFRRFFDTPLQIGRNTGVESAVRTLNDIDLPSAFHVSATGLLLNYG